MNKKLFLTSVFAVCIASPAMAEGEVSTITNSSQCDNDTLGTYSGTANVEAIWTIDPRTCTAGQSYDSTTNTCITCTAGNYCPGGTFNVNSQTNGLNTCPNGYALSESGAGADTDCYRTCTTSDVAHSTGVSGGFYYGDNNQCEATSCANGWHLKERVSLPENINPSVSSVGYGNGSYLGTFGANAQNDSSYYGMIANDEPQQWAVDMGDVVVHGIARCRTSGSGHYSYMNQTDESDTLANVTDESGQEGANHCWCKINSYKVSGTNNFETISSSWVYDSSLTPCEYSCGSYCATSFGRFENFRKTLIRSIPTSLASCEANNIALKWYNDQTEVVPVNSAAEQCTYNETITIPTNEPTKTGYTFGGWKLRTNN